MIDDKVKIAKTESLFRAVNERIAEIADRLHADEAEFMCECADVGCAERLPVPLDDYEEVREAPTQFLVAPGHEKAEVERILRRRPRYAVVEKVERTVAGLVRRLDPRAQPA